MSQWHRDHGIFVNAHLNTLPSRTNAGDLPASCNYVASVITMQTSEILEIYYGLSAVTNHVLEFALRASVTNYVP
jgi:hypothetical protein